MIDFLLFDSKHNNMLLRKSLRIRLRRFNDLVKVKVKINECRNKTVVFHYNKNETIEYFKEMKEICRENIKNRRQLIRELFIENMKEKKQ